MRRPKLLERGILVLSYAGGPSHGVPLHEGEVWN
jgi:hypothetical protein